jgi:hypothetical protein
MEVDGAMIDRKPGAPHDAADQEAERPPWWAGRVKVGVLVAVAVAAGFVGRSIATGDAGDNPLLNWLPWLHRTPITLYFGETTGEYLVPVSRTLSRSAEPAEMVDAFLTGPEPGAGLRSLVAGGVSVREAVLDGTTLRVELEGEAGAFDDPLAREALFQSLASWPGADDVEVTVGGAVLDDEGSSGHLVHFYDEALDMLVAHPVPATSPREVLEVYLDGPGTAGLVGLPDDVRLLAFSLDRSRDLLSLDFTYLPSVRSLAVDHPQAMRRVLEGLIATLTTGFPEIGAVWLDFEGHEALGLGQCADLLRTAQTQPEVLNDERLLRRYAEA